MQVYIYAADIYCKDCGEAIRKRIIEEGFAPKDPEDEGSYDSDEFPKGPYPDGGGETDSPQHCGAGPDCLNAIEFSDDHKIGAWLENELTTNGVKYVQRAVQSGGEVAGLWAKFYKFEIMQTFWYYIWNEEKYRLRAVIEAETITIADKIFQQDTGLDPRSQGISVTLEPLA